MIDYLVVGLGLAGISFCETLERNGKTFKVISDASQQASVVAGGLYNPVILKRFTLAWRADEQLEVAIPFYKSLENKLKTSLDYKLRVLRRFASIEEQNMWFEAADNPGLQSFLSTKLIKNTNPHIDAPLGFGEVLHTGRIDTKALIQHYCEYLKKKKLLSEASFEFNQLTIEDSFISYKGIQAKQLVFATGFGLQQNPYFNYLPLNGTKGELLTIKAPLLKQEHVIKSSVFIIPLGDDLYRIGATYKWQDKTNLPTEAARSELLEKLATFMKCNYEILQHVAGIRPTVADRRPLVGQHPEYKNLFILNGFGSRGVMIAPYASQALFNAVEKGSNLPKDMDVVRFQKRYKRS